MKKLLYLIAITTLLTSLFAFRTIAHYIDIFKQLEIQQEDAKDYVFSNLEAGKLAIPYSSVIPKLALGKREAAVIEIGNFMKTYTASAEFAAKYKEARESNRALTEAEAKAKVQTRQAELRKEIATLEADMKKSDASLKKLQQLLMNNHKDELKALTDPTHPGHVAQMEQVTGVNLSEKSIAQNYKEWQEKYPPTVRELVKKRLTQFLEYTSDIDFNAKLVKRGDKMVFADASLEGKDETWKRCFRSGRETITAARQFAQQWLASLK
jgi:hypothetical protein